MVLASVALVAVSALTVASIGSAKPAAPAKLRVALVTDVGGLNDKSFNALAYKGLKDAQKKLGIDGRVFISKSSADYIPNLTAGARQYDLVVGVGFLMADQVAAVAKRFPDKKFAIVDFAAGSPALNASLARLLQNQTDIGNAIAPYYGKAAGRKLTALLREHILIAVDVLKAAKSGNKAATNRALARWNANADRISAFLSAANPKNWPEAAVRSMMREHLALTTTEAVARLQGRWAADVRAADAVERAMLHMADTLSGGIVAQFPGRFGKGTT